MNSDTLSSSTAPPSLDTGDGGASSAPSSLYTGDVDTRKKLNFTVTVPPGALGLRLRYDERGVYILSNKSSRTELLVNDVILRVGDKIVKTLSECTDALSKDKDRERILLIERFVTASSSTINSGYPYPLIPANNSGNPFPLIPVANTCYPYPLFIPYATERKRLTDSERPVKRKRQTEEERAAKRKKLYHDRKQQYELIHNKPEEERTQVEKAFIHEYEEKRDLNYERSKQWRDDRKQEYLLIHKKPEEERTQVEKDFIHEYEEKRDLNIERSKQWRDDRKQEYLLIHKKPEEERTQVEKDFIHEYEEKLDKARSNQRYHDRKQEYLLIHNKPEEERTQVEKDFIHEYEEKRDLNIERSKQRRDDRKQEYELIHNKPEEERTQVEKDFIHEYEEKRDLNSEKTNQRYHDRKQEYELIHKKPEEERTQVEKDFIHEYEEKIERLKQRRDARKQEYELIHKKPEEERTQEERMFMYDYKHHLELNNERNKKYRRERGSLTIEEFEEAEEKFMEEVAIRCPDPSIVPSTSEMITRYLQDKNNEKNLEDIKKYFFARMLFEGYNIYHFGVCPIEKMKKILTDDGKKKDVVYPYLQFEDPQFYTLPHVDHLDPPQTIIQRGISAATSELYSWWLQRFMESIRVGLNHAFVRNNIKQIKGAQVYIFGKHEPKEKWGIRFFRAANHQLQNMRNFVVTQNQVIPDFVLKITFGKTGFFDPHTTIDLVRMGGQVCNIRIWGP